MLILLQWTFFFIISQMLFQDAHGQCREATLEDCRKANSVPGYNLAGEGFDVTTLRRKSVSIISLDDKHSANSTCILCRNPLLGDQRQWLPQAVGSWRVFPKCSLSLTSELYESSTELTESLSSNIQNDWSIGLEVKKAIGIVFAGSQSQLSQFSIQKSKQDRFSFSTQEVVCKQYRYHIKDQSALNPQFAEQLKSLPKIYNNQTKTRYDALINNYGTHYIHQVELGGRIRAVTALQTCKITLDQLSDHEVNECLKMEASIKIFGASSKSESKRCKTIKETILSKRNFSNKFSERKMEVVGGDISMHTDLFFSKSSNRESFKSWISSLSSLPDLISYSLVPLHKLIPDTEPTRQHLQRAISKYIFKRAMDQKCLPCPTGGWFTQHSKCKCACNPTSQITHSCCPKQRGRASFSVTIHHSKGLKGDLWPNPTDGYVKVFLGASMRRTRTIKNNNNPVWHERLDFGEILLTPELQLRVEVWDKDWKWDDLLGSCKRHINAKATVQGELCYFHHGNLYFSYKATCGHQLFGRYCSHYIPPRN